MTQRPRVDTNGVGRVAGPTARLLRCEVALLHGISVFPCGRRDTVCREAHLTEFYVANKEEGPVYGPFDEQQVRDLVSEGRLDAASFICEDNGPWTTLDRAPQFAHLFSRPRDQDRPWREPEADDYERPVAGYRPWPGSAGQSYHGYAVAGLVCSLLGSCGGCLLAVLGLIFSSIALNGMKRSGNEQGKGLATAGVVLGIVGIVAFFILMAFVFTHR